MKTTASQKAKMKVRDFISREVFKITGLKNKLMSTGYEAYRISPRASLKHGLSLKRIYGASVSPAYNRPTGKKNKFGNPTKFGADVKWYPHGWVSSKAKSGTFLLQSLRDYPVDQKEAKRKLMIK